MFARVTRLVADDVTDDDKDFRFLVVVVVVVVDVNDVMFWVVLV